MQKPFLVYVRNRIENLMLGRESTSGVTIQDASFSHLIIGFRQVFDRLENSKKSNDAKEEALARCGIFEIFDRIMQTYLLSESTFYYARYLRAKIPDTCAKTKIFEDIDFSGEAPELVYKSFRRADNIDCIIDAEKCFMTAFIHTVFKNINYGIPNVHARIIRLENQSLKNLNLIHYVEQLSIPAAKATFTAWIKEYLRH